MLFFVINRYMAYVNAITINTSAMEKTLLFEFGTEGGGAEVYRLPDNRVLEMGSSGGMLDDEEEDPVRSWEVMFVDFEHWWKHFLTQNGSFWIYFYPIFMHDEVKPIIKSSVEQYISQNGAEAGHHEKWEYCLNSGNRA